MRKHDICGLIVAAGLAYPGVALANNECSNGEWNVVFKIANKTEYQFTAEIQGDYNVDTYLMPVLAPETTGWNACFHAVSAVDAAGVSVAYFRQLEEWFTVTFELKLNSDNEYVENAVADGYQDSPVTLSYNRSKQTLTISDAN